MPLVRGRLKGGWTEKDLDEVIAYKIKQNEEVRMMTSDPKAYNKMVTEGRLSKPPKAWQDIVYPALGIKGGND